MELKLGAQATTSTHWLTLGKIRLSVAIVYLFILPVLYDKIGTNFKHTVKNSNMHYDGNEKKKIKK